MPCHPGSEQCAGNPSRLLSTRLLSLVLQVPVIMALIHSKLQEVDEEHLRKAAQQTVYILASQHKTAVVSSLLGSSLPFDRYLARAIALAGALHALALLLGGAGLRRSFHLSCS